MENCGCKLNEKIKKGINMKLDTHTHKIPKSNDDTNYLDPSEKTVSKKFWSKS